MSLLKKHWQKFIIASFASFWASCSDSESSTQPIYEEPSSSSNATTSSSNETTPNSSSNVEPTSNNSENTIRPSSSSSNSIPQIEPLYGVVQEPLQPTCKPSVVESYSIPPCHDEICPDYGVEIVKTEGCDCSDGSSYTLEQFSNLFGVNEDAARECNPGNATGPNNSSEENSSSSMGIDESPFVKDTAFIDQPAVYGPPCYFNGTCNDVPSTEEKE
ncbi:hypothetical protein [Fibrobacter sp. UWH3]|uniref:hypothetical protein n=1 Tax=Fibrobacter sp. UWH3 TaxID=1964353 RepID=UPI001130F43D|nr:hypothetical protein [Fibrobacter sp. UWH3]